MKKIVFLSSLVSISLFAKAQTVEFGMGGGVGYLYLVEQIQAYDINYYNSVSFYSDLTFRPDSAKLGLKMQIQYLYSDVQGQDWEAPLPSYYPFNPLFYGGQLYGSVTSFSAFALFDYQSNWKKNLTWGWDFGPGITQEELIRNVNFPELNTTRRFISFRLAGSLGYQFGKRSRINFSPVFIWNDPINSFSEQRYRLAGEDLHFLLNIGYAYSFL